MYACKICASSTGPNVGALYESVITILIAGFSRIKGPKFFRTALLKTVPEMATPKTDPTVRKKVALAVATAMSLVGTADWMASMSVCIEKPRPHPLMNR